MAKTTKKLVLSCDPEAQSYTPAGHNLTDDQAVELAGKLQADGKGSQIVDQESHHRALSFHQCKPCKEAASDATAKHSQASGQQVEPPPVAKDRENEGD